MSDESKGKILLVDDDKFLADMYGMKFSQAGYTPEVFLSCKSALETLRGGFDPAAILFDIVMPDMDGFAFLKTLSDEKLGARAVKIALTNQSDDIEKKKAEELGATRYIVKASMIPSEVVDAVGEELKKHK